MVSLRKKTEAYRIGESQPEKSFISIAQAAWWIIDQKIAYCKTSKKRLLSFCTIQSRISNARAEGIPEWGYYWK